MSVKISKLSVQVKNLAQKLALDERAGRNK
jgi:hypothetical protein